MPANIDAVHRAGRKWEDCAARLMSLLRGEMRTALTDAENRAHIATIGDRPFLGCNPGRVSAPTARAVPAEATHRLSPRPTAPAGSAVGNVNIEEGRERHSK